MLIAQDNCSNENNILVYLQQIFQELKSSQNRVDYQSFWSNLVIPEHKVGVTGGWEVFTFNETPC